MPGLTTTAHLDVAAVYRVLRVFAAPVRFMIPKMGPPETSVIFNRGGNCKTVMVGTAAIEDRHLEEPQP